MKTYQPVLDFGFILNTHPIGSKTVLPLMKKFVQNFMTSGTLFLELNVGIGVNLFMAV